MLKFTQTWPHEDTHTDRQTARVRVRGQRAEGRGSIWDTGRRVRKGGEDGGEGGGCWVLTGCVQLRFAPQ